MVPPAWGSSPSPCSTAGETETEMEGGGDLVLAALPASSSNILATVSTDSLGAPGTATRVVGCCEHNHAYRSVLQFLF